MINLLEETKNCLESDGYTPEDITFIGSADHQYEISWEAFTTIADVEYYRGFGSAKVATDLVIELRDGTWYSRGEYDGSEWWELNKKLPMFVNPSPIHTLVVGERFGGWKSVDELNKNVSMANDTQKELP